MQRKQVVVTLLAVALLNAGFLAGTVLGGEKWNAQHPRRAEVNQRLKNQNARIKQGVKSGALQSSFFGFAVESAPLNSITRIRVFGIAVATASAAITAGAIVGCAANRQVVTYTAAHQQVGYACSTTALAADPMLVLIDRASNA